MASYDRQTTDLHSLTENCGIVSSFSETNAKTERLIHMSRYVEFLAIVNDFRSITDVKNNYDDDDLNDLIAKMEPIRTYLNELSDKQDVKDLVPQCSFANIEGSGYLPLIEEYLSIRIDAMRNAFIETCWVIGDMELVAALSEINNIVDSFLDD